MKRIAVFASGQGTNAANLIRFFEQSPLARVVWVASNRCNAGVIGLAQSLGVEATCFPDAAWQSGAVEEQLLKRRIDLIVLAGFLKLVPPGIIKEYENRIINIHPALLPRFGGKGMYGLNVHKAVQQAREAETGITVHFVNEQFDEGETIAQFKIPLTGNEEAKEIEQKVRALELQHFPEVVRAVIQKL
ncbi:MAG TPA: phosphoribosylglycinamide formyltransferase [Bacteroidia bacterium]|nr:phosphoribosylglycinamide formyltransferase [Bacteroidia bacterium]